MSFITDQQTLNDLNLLGRHRRASIFNLFCQTQTRGGERLLEEWFRRPMTDIAAINDRSSLIRYFAGLGLVFPLKADQVEAMENYLESPGQRNMPAAVWQTLQRKAMASLAKDERDRQLQEGLISAVNGLRITRIFLQQLVMRDPGGPYADRARAALSVLEDRQLSSMADNQLSSWLTVARYDHLLRTRLRDGLETVRAVLNELDVYIAVGQLASDKGWGFATALPAGDNIVRIDGLRHPAVNNAVGNTISLDNATNMLFLTGANMAGKSTFMKAFGIALYLAHMGFPVAASEMVFSVRDGLFSSINVADDLNLGHSHFYAEVLRVKNVAQAVSEGRRLVVLFDELFKGTNVKDAYDGTLAVTEAFSKYRRSAFIISTHIVEAGEALRIRRDNIQFAYLPTELENGRPHYPYILREGIAADRVGMMIIENEGIIGIIKK